MIKLINTNLIPDIYLFILGHQKYRYNVIIKMKFKELK